MRNALLLCVRSFLFFLHTNRVEMTKERREVKKANEPKVEQSCFHHRFAFLYLSDSRLNACSPDIRWCWFKCLTIDLLSVSEVDHKTIFYYFLMTKRILKRTTTAEIMCQSHVKPARTPLNM